MTLKNLSLVLFALIAGFVAVAPMAYANEEAKACTADADCGHGEHCKDGHCHKA
ncbi:MAG: hypothetical protein K1X83_11235 [Oligoflexia bacterium]|nr:hypothetical protein [Oligoflexia bacterium]